MFLTYHRHGINVEMGMEHPPQNRKKKGFGTKSIPFFQELQPFDGIPPAKFQALHHWFFSDPKLQAIKIYAFSFSKGND